MDAREDFVHDLEWREAMRRLFANAPEVCEAFAALDAEHGFLDLLGHADPRVGIEALKRASVDAQSREVFAAFTEALIEAETAVARELWGAQARPIRPPRVMPIPPLGVPGDYPVPEPRGRGVVTVGDARPR
jgi:hypothetical protein